MQGGTSSSRAEADGLASVVQFPHPGVEPSATGNVVRWNTAPGHHRKFLISQGRVVDAAGRVVAEEELLFWGEWEPPSRIVRRWQQHGELPTAVHAPHWESPGPRCGRQNTDPWVFGDHFLYSNCKQASCIGLQHLPRGSVILFGSKLNGRFVLDTVFVVAELVCRWNPVTDPRLESRAFYECTVRSLSSMDQSYTLYRGAVPEDPVRGMFSFVPCSARRGDAWPRFARPTVVLPGVVNPESGRSTRGAGVLRRIEDVWSCWTAVVHQVQGQGLQLGYGIPIPPVREGPPPEDGEVAETISCSPRKPPSTRVIC